MDRNDQALTTIWHYENMMAAMNPNQLPAAPLH
jgi:hypothetical protein